MIYQNYLKEFYEKFPESLKNSFTYDEMKNYLFFGIELQIDLQNIIEYRNEGWLDATAIKCCLDNVINYDILDENEMTEWANKKALLIINTYTVERLQAEIVAIKTDGKLN